MRYLIFAAIGIALACAPCAQAQAVTQARQTQIPASVACQLSMPTTDTSVRAKATGFRNEGKASTYAICGLQDPVQGAITDVGIAFYALDGKSHTFSCTAVNGWPDVESYVYSTKSITASSPTFRSSLHFAPADFGGTTYLPNEGYITVTCSLPPQVSVGYLYMSYDEDVGN
ncbi:MAG: hypothetical protein QM719_10355 [Thermomonas sp.]